MFIQATLNGLLLGGIYGIATVGFSMVWGGMGIINLAHTAFIMIGAYITFVLFAHFGMDPLATLPLSMVALFVVGYVLQAAVMNRILDAGLLLSLVISFGVNLAIVDLFNLLFTSDVRAVNVSYAAFSLDWAGTSIPLVRLITAALAVGLGLALFAVVRRTRIGQAIVATALDREVSSLMGLNPLRIYALTAGVGAALAGATGSLASMIFPVTPAMGAAFLGAIFVITVLGGIGSVEGSIVAGFAYGLAQSWAALLLGPSSEDLVAFVLFLIVLVVRPQGLFGRRFFGEQL
ncbi:MAG: branched-chain amino acid ABC transporter permease [Acetobacteraceae bacterium]